MNDTIILLYYFIYYTLLHIYNALPPFNAERTLQEVQPEDLIPGQVYLIESNQGIGHETSRYRELLVKRKSNRRKRKEIVKQENRVKHTNKFI